MDRQALVQQIKEKQSYLCVGLDPDINKLPPHLLNYDNPVLEFNKAIIEATSDLCVAYKTNVAFYEALGLDGMKTLYETAQSIPDTCFTIADAKRGDIGNTSKMYAKAFLKDMDFDSITIAPYMGQDSVQPFMSFDGKWVILLGLTSNQGNKDFQRLKSGDKYIYEHVIQTAMQWGSEDNMMFVIGATNEEDFQHIRSFCPNHFFLVPGVGAQGGDLEKLSLHGLNQDCGLLVNSTRGIIYASNGKDFAEKAREQAILLQQQMKSLLQKHHII